MKLHSPLETPERILLYGQPGTGKSRAALSVASVIGDSKMFVVDTDYSASYGRLMATDFPEAANVEVQVVDGDDWHQIIGAVRSAVSQAQAGDWVVLDSVSPSWQAIQTHYIIRRHGEEFLDVFALSGADAKRQTSDADMNWQAINAEYNKLYKALFLAGAHLLVTAEADAVDAKRDDVRVKGLYESVGFKPRGQKALGHTTHTVLLTGKRRSGEFTMTTVKDRGRPEVENEPVADFAKDYLMKVAGWKPVVRP
jgi:hypothetical protein